MGYAVWSVFIYRRELARVVEVQFHFDLFEEV